MDYIKLRDELINIDTLEVELKKKKTLLEIAKDKAERIKGISVKEIQVQGGVRGNTMEDCILAYVEIQNDVEDCIKKLEAHIRAKDELLEAARKWNEEEKRLLDLKLEGKTYEEIAEEIEVSSKTVYNKLDKMGLVEKKCNLR